MGGKIKMSFKEILEKAVNMGTEIKYIVYINNEEPQKLNYIQLGTFLVSKGENIKNIKITTKV